MKDWQVILLCASVLASAFYIKYEPDSLIASNYGYVHLGNVFSERALIDVNLVDKNNSSSSKEIADGANFYDKYEGFSEFVKDLSDDWDESYAGKSKLKVRTYMRYSSSNFISMPYDLTLREETYDLTNDISLAANIEDIINKNFDSSKNSVSESLFITDGSAYGLDKNTNE